MDPIGAWTADPRIKTYMETTSGQPWSKAKCRERAEWLIRWAKAHHAVLLLDDAHHLGGRKLDIAQRLALVPAPWSPAPVRKAASRSTCA